MFKTINVFYLSSLGRIHHFVMLQLTYELIAALISSGQSFIGIIPSTYEHYSKGNVKLVIHNSL